MHYGKRVVACTATALLHAVAATAQQANHWCSSTTSMKYECESEVCINVAARAPGPRTHRSTRRQLFSAWRACTPQSSVQYAINFYTHRSRNSWEEFVGLQAIPTGRPDNSSTGSSPGGRRGTTGSKFRTWRFQWRIQIRNCRCRLDDGNLARHQASRQQKSSKTINNTLASPAKANLI